jgi:alpha-ketoglutarate-dependent taurine dioxygenase
MEYQHIDVARATPRVGAYISGVDLNNVTEKKVYDEVRRAVHEFGVVFFRNQPLEPRGFVELGRQFGTLEMNHPVFGSPKEHPEVQLIKFDPKLPIETQAWHTDNTYNERPSAYTFLRAMDIPSVGGDTLWASNGAIYEDLPKPFQDMLASLEARNDLYWRLREMDYLARTGKKGTDAKFLDLVANHPVVIRHPITGRPQLLVNRLHTCTINGIPDHLSDGLLHLLLNLVKQPDYQVRLKWEKDTVVIWDNLATQHYATQDYSPYPRCMMRMVVAGEARPEPLDASKMYAAPVAEEAVVA